MSRFGNMRNSNALTAFVRTMRMSFACRLAYGLEELLKEVFNILHRCQRSRRQLSRWTRGNWHRAYFLVVKLFYLAHVTFSFTLLVGGCDPTSSIKRHCYRSLCLRCDRLYGEITKSFLGILQH